jgi:hypothetical protein
MTKNNFEKETRSDFTKPEQNFVYLFLCLEKEGQ